MAACFRRHSRGRPVATARGNDPDPARSGPTEDPEGTHRPEVALVPALAPGVGSGLMSVARLARAVLDSDVDLDAAAVRRRAAELRHTVAPLLDAGSEEQVVAHLLGLGPIQPLVEDPTVSDILVNGPKEVFVEREGRLIRTDVRFDDESQVLAAVERVVSPLGLRLDPASPIVDARLPDGSRLSAAMPPACIGGPIVAIRRFTEAVETLSELELTGSAGAAQVAALRHAVGRRWNILVSGGTGSGKTTLLNLLSREIPPHERVVVIEDSAELQLRGHVVRLEARPPNVDGAGAITLERLLKAALRMRPDRLIVGEVRGPESLDLIAALNTGHDGSMATVHANSPDEALWRLETLAMSGSRRVSATVIARQLRRALGLIVQMERRDGVRRIASMARVRG